MARALAYAAKGLGRVAPNPAVACLIVSPEGRLLARGRTGEGGRPHAETVALARAGAAARGATAYVTLEPCAHHGATPPCAEALVSAGVARVVAALVDPDPRVAGRGLARLTEAGIAVTRDVGAAQAAALNAGFLMRLAQGRPLVTLKLATTLDGRIATHTGESRWITGETARAAGHLLRAEADAILVGAVTAVRDDPLLTVRLPGLARRAPVRIVADSWLRLPLTAALVRTAGTVPTWILCRAEAEMARREAFAAAGVTLIPLPAGPQGSLDLAAGLRALGERGLTRLLVEGGAHLAASLLRAGCVDRLEWFRAGALLGGDATPAIAGLGLTALDRMPRFTVTGRKALGDDILESFVAEA